jgi:hypothetical protein
VDNRGTHLGDGAYIVPDPYGHSGQVWLAANDHRNRVVAVDGSAINLMLRWLIEHHTSIAVEALTGVGTALEQKLEDSK